PKNYLVREHIRNTYGRNHVKFKYKFNHENVNSRNFSHCFLFSIGYIDNQEINLQVDFEAFVKKDIIRIPLFEEYRKIIHKIIVTFYLLDQMKIPFKFILKSDEDIFLKINDIIPYINRFKESDVFIGRVITGAIPYRDKTHKWYVDPIFFPTNVFDDYLNGACYVLRRNIVNSLVKKHYMIPLIPIEDVHISHIVTKLGYKLTNSDRFHHCVENIQCKNSF
ncbi:hypothetical protein HZS_1540, partial [Henneguya salminicola]